MSKTGVNGPHSSAKSGSGRAAATTSGQLVGLDGSDGARHALSWAAARTDRLGRIQPLTSWYFPWWAYTGPAVPPEAEFKKLARERAESALSSIPDDRRLPLIVCQGQPGKTIVDVGSNSGLIVLGTRGLSGLKDAVLGSVSAHVVAHATTPVAVVPAEAPIEDVNKRVVVGVDGSSNSAEALVWALTHTPDDSKVEVVHTWTYPTSAVRGLAVEPRRDFETWATATLDQTVEAALNTIGPTAAAELLPRIEKRLEYGDARSVLRELQVDSDLLVLGARGRGGLAHLFVGSVTSALIHQPLSTMVVVRWTGSR